MLSYVFLDHHFKNYFHVPLEYSHFWSKTDQPLTETEVVCVGQLKWQRNDMCAVEGICVVWHIWSSLLFSLENSWWSLAVHHSIYHQYFVIVCRNSHKVEFSADILCCDFFREFCSVPKTNADSWSLLNAQRKVKAVSFFETNPALQPCPPCPWKTSRITQ